MFENLTERLTIAFKNFSGQGRFSEENMQDALQSIRTSLLEADVAFPVVKHFIEQIKLKTYGQKVEINLKADQALVKIVYDELVALLGDKRAELNFQTQTPAVILLAGLQGAGKTTTAAKLAYHLKNIDKKKVMLVSTDVYRPAAILQLQQLAQQIEVLSYPVNKNDKPVEIVKQAIDSAKKQYIDVLILDTAGRLHVDVDMMTEIRELHQLSNPCETLFVVDSMTGQDAANTAKIFHDTLPLTGVILTKTDGDARGGAALSVKYITQQPIKFFGNGEKIDALEAFHPERVASLILGMGDILSLIEEVERKADHKTKEQLSKKLKQGKSFTLDDFKKQLLQVNNLGGIAGMASKLPGMGQLSPQALDQVNDKTVARTIAIINSMTKQERYVPKIINGSRKRRIAQGSGLSIPDVNRLLKQFEQMQKMMKKLTKPGAMKNMARGLGGISGLQNLLPGARFKNNKNG